MFLEYIIKEAVKILSSQLLFEVYALLSIFITKSRKYSINMCQKFVKRILYSIKKIYGGNIYGLK